jgi:hypothetical protein
LLFELFSYSSGVLRVLFEVGEEFAVCSVRIAAIPVAVAGEAPGWRGGSKAPRIYFSIVNVIFSIGGFFYSGISIHM